MSKQGKLELTWIGKENRPRLEPRILLEDPSRSYHAAQRVSEKDVFDNRLIFGDNLLALKALEQEFTDKIKCVYIDPPFNTQQAMEHYDDGVEHSLWLTLMRDRLVILHRLLANDGTLFVHIDDNELGYLILLLDELFGRPNRVSVVTFKQGSATGHKAINPGCVNTTNYLLLYAKNKAMWKPERVFTGRERDTRYGQYVVNIDEPYQDWEIITLTKAFAKSLGVTDKEARKIIKDDPQRLELFVLEKPRRVIRTARPDYDGVSEAARDMIDASKRTPKVILKLERDDHSDMYFRNGERILFYSDKLKLVDGQYVAGEPLTTLWDDILSNNLHNEGGVDFPKGKKPEALIKRVFELVTSPGDWVLDSFAGSGTTGAVAHKMRRHWIMVELGEHCHTHVIPRLKQVIDGNDPDTPRPSPPPVGGWPGGRGSGRAGVLRGFSPPGSAAAGRKQTGPVRPRPTPANYQSCNELRLNTVGMGEESHDPSGVTEATEWQGGGGFRYYRLAPSLLEKDRYGNWVINKQYNAAMLAEAMCKHMGFTYDPSPTDYWQQGHSTERDFIFTTTQTLTRPQLLQLSEAVGKDRSLLVSCKAFHAEAGAFPNLTLQKIPKSILSRCEFGRDDYSLQIAKLPARPAEEEEEAFPPAARSPHVLETAGQASLFDSSEDAP